ncbi:C-C motif chemokine 8-like [Seriola lalandi dorsalis]|uniref:C-C motif chemokine 8-like n=1 Tax=Seriola lalandi dorsalis TaxID=1841481 RepID=A0A3B4WE84_SERLL|nr:C-C motif chemokine 8-like [Seriola lalandi dorsalis]
MAPWGDAKLFFCILFITCCCTVTLAQIPLDCCLTVKNKVVDKKAIVDYRQQVRGMGCAIDATVLIGRRGKTLCVPPHEPWVKDVVKHVDHLKKVCKKNNKTNRCNGVTS